MTYLPACSRKRNSRNKRVVKVGDVYPEVVKGHSLRPGLIPQALHRIKLLKRCIASRVNETTNEHKSNHNLCLPGSLDLWRSVIAEVDRLSIRTGLQIRSNERANDGEDEYQ
jgi:hypothetical protein